MTILTRKEFQADLAKMWSEAVHAEYKAQIDEAVLEEREACAKICDRMAQRTQDIRSAALESAAENIRARGNT